MSELEFLESSSSSVFEKIVAAHTLATWYVADGSVAVKLRTEPSATYQVARACATG